MRVFVLMASILFICFGCRDSKKAAHHKDSFDEIMAQRNTEVKKLWEEGKYPEFITCIQETNRYIQKNGGAYKAKYQNLSPSVYYYISRAFAILNQKDSAFANLQKAIELGYTDYYGLSKDTSFKSLRDDIQYRSLLEQIKNFSYEEILAQFPAYSEQKIILPYYTYQSENDKGLNDLREKYKLDSVAGNGDEISKIINLMGWVHNTVRHSNGTYPPDRHADAMIEFCKIENRGGNCRVLATILNETYLAMGFKSHFVTCLPLSKTDHECHVINCVFSKTLNKWVWMDPTFDTWVKDEKGNYLDIEEVRERLVKGLPVKTSPRINWNGKSHDGEEYLHHYMAKNLFQLNIPLNSCAAFENADYKPRKESIMLPKTKKNMSDGSNLKGRTYIQLIPANYKPENIEPGKLINGVYYTTDSKQFWKKPQ